MGRTRQPIDLIKAKGKKHLTEEEYETRKAQELEVPFTDIEPPEYLTAKQKREFMGIAEKLLQLNIMTELDVDVLAQYCIAKTLYLDYCGQIKKILAKNLSVRKWEAIDKIAATCDDAQGIIELLESIMKRQRADDTAVLMTQQDKAFKQCLACAKELGMTITSRCKLIIPQPPDDDDDEL